MNYNEKEWMVENLKSKLGYNDAYVPNKGQLWKYPQTAPNSDKYGLLYNNEVIYFGKMIICPDGWHLASLDDWNEIIAMVGENNASKLILKEQGGSDDYNFGGALTNAVDWAGYSNSASWHTNDYVEHRDLFFNMTVEKLAVINMDNGTIGFMDEPYPSVNMRSLRCVKGAQRPVITTNDPVNLTPNSCDIGYTVIRQGDYTITKRGVRYGTKADNLDNEILISEESTNQVTINGLTPCTQYYFEAFVQFDGGEVKGGVIKVETLTESVIYNGYEYSTFIFNGKVCFVENLRTEKYNDGTTIPSIQDQEQWKSTQEGAYCINSTAYNEDFLWTEDKYGKLYNGYAVDSGKLCPQGWRCLNYDDMEKYKMSCGDFLLSPKGNWYPGTYVMEELMNSTGFSAMPAGYIDSTGTFAYNNEDGGTVAGFWLYPTSSNNPAFLIHVNSGNIYSKDSIIYLLKGKESDVTTDLVKNFGFSVRCVKE